MSETKHCETCRCADREERPCGRREYSGDGVYFTCRLPIGHPTEHDYGWGPGRRVPAGAGLS